jgi:flagellar biosynthesis protein FlhF
MRLRSFTASSIAEAMRQVRAALGEDAVILATEEQGRSVKITAAIDPGALTSPAAKAVAAAPYLPPDIAEGGLSDVIAQALRFHGVPQALLERLLAMISTFGIDDAGQALTAALRARFAFQPLNESLPKKPIVLAGLPGAGKSSTLAKLAARAKVNNWPATAITCDLAKAGAVEQLATYAKALEIPAYRAKDAATLRRAVERSDAKGMILVDTIGTNPLLQGDLAQLRELVAAVNGDLVLVMAAGGDVNESAELAAAYAEAGATRLIATKVDLTRRYGGILAAAEAGRLAFAGFGTSPQIASGLAAPRPDRLCRLFLPDAGDSHGSTHGPTPPQNGKSEKAGAESASAAKPTIKPSPSKPLRGAAS